MQSREQGEEANMALAHAAAVASIFAAVVCCCFSPHYRTEHKHGELDYGQLAGAREKKRGGQKAAVNTETSDVHVRTEGNRK